MKVRATTLALTACLAACSSTETASGSGSLNFVTWGEEYIEQEIPFTQEGETIIEDGYTIKYTKFLVAVGNIKVADVDGQVASELKGLKIVDHTKPGRKNLASFASIPAKGWTRVSYEIAPVEASSELAGASDADKALMLKGGFSIYVEGSLRKGAEAKTFSWGFTTATIFDRCKSLNQDGKTETDGVIVKNGVKEDVELTIHGDHFFYDDLQSSDAKVRGGNVVAADVNNDGIVTLEELSQKKLATIPAESGKYGTGSTSGINDMGAFVAALSRTVGHFRGEGECISIPKR
jgi:hypothetical protein